MFPILAGMAAVILLGVLWRLILGGKNVETIRSHLAKAVYEVFLPALVLHVMWQTEANINVLRVPVVASIGVLVSLLAAVLIYGDGKRLGGKRAAGAMLLAAGFGNVTYLGLPILTQTFGPWAQSIAIPYDLFASTPLLFTIGILIARHYGGPGSKPLHPCIEVLRVPAIWAAVFGIMASTFGIPMPAWLDETLGVLGAAVIPLMLLSIGMAMRWQSGWVTRIPLLLPMITIQLIFMPLVVWGACIGVGMPENYLAPAVLEGAMPCMVLGLVVCDRFKLDSSLYAEAVTVTTGLSLISLPVWLNVIRY